MQRIVWGEGSLFSSVLGRQKYSGAPLRWSRFVLFEPVEGGTLLFNALTRVLVFTDAALDARTDPASLPDAALWQERWFLIPQDANELQTADQLGRVTEMVYRASLEAEEKSSFTVYTTTACNARCPYCFEKGYAPVTMREEDADRAAAFIRSHAAGRNVSLRWFGGEPLLNTAAIERICADLRRDGVSFRSSIITNGYLWTEESVASAKENWKLDWAQITLDGTEESYNACKRYVCSDPSPYRRVLRNIGMLLEAGIAVGVRLNLTLENAEELLRLIDELQERFGGSKDFGFSLHELFEYDFLSADPAWQDGGRILDAYRRLLLRLEDYGHSLDLAQYSRPRKHCMADSARSFAIYPTGELLKCDHFRAEEVVGDVVNGVTDPALVKSWRERSAKTALCRDCPLYPACVRLKKCPDEPADCSPMMREIRLFNCRRGMRTEWRRVCKSEQEKA